MLTTIKRLLPPCARQAFKNHLSFRQWRARGYAAPSPGRIKQAVLLRNGAPASIWVETGTYLGDTSAFLSRHAKRVFTIEPAKTIHELAVRRLAPLGNVEVIHGASEDVFPKLLPGLAGDVTFWLDGHFSGGETWATHQGAKDTPIVEELEQIERNRSRFAKLSVLVDDIRSFEAPEQYKDYPTLDFLVDWARRNNLRWHIEHDIFVARNF